MEISPDLVRESDLIIDAIYKSENHNHIGGDVVSKIFSVGNSGGFRKCGRKDTRLNYVVLYTSGEDKNWVDTLDLTRGILTYYGDNKKPGVNLNATKKSGNKWLEEIFLLLHEGKRSKIPPIFLVEKLERRDIRFRGLLVPGEEGNLEDLVALWKSEGKERYQNYKATFTVLDEGLILKDWLRSLEEGQPVINQYTPKKWAQWVEKGIYKPLISEPVEKAKSKEEQIPSKKEELKMIKEIHSYFEKSPTEFEKCAAKLVELMDSNVISCDVTQRSRDGGRDAIGVYKIGSSHTPVKLEFALEAKLYDIDNSVGVKEISRLISRIKHREFGFFVTTSYIGGQAYKEFIVEDQHPINIITAIDIVNILKSIDLTTAKMVRDWLEQNFEF